MFLSDEEKKLWGSKIPAMACSRLNKKFQQKFKLFFSFLNLLQGRYLIKKNILFILCS